MLALTGECIDAHIMARQRQAQLLLERTIMADAAGTILIRRVVTKMAGRVADVYFEEEPGRRSRRLKGPGHAGGIKIIALRSCKSV